MANVLQKRTKAHCSSGLPGASVKRQARAIHLVHVTTPPGSSKPTFTLTDAGRAFLQTIQAPFATVVIVGPYRSGKSFLSNSLIRSAGIDVVKPHDQFKVAGTQRACTYGLWISTVPIECVDPVTGKLFNAFVVDVEGFDSTSASAEHDALLFAMSMFFSSLLVLNAQRTITQSSMSNLAMVVDLCKHIQFSSGGTALEDARSLGETFTPELLVVVRDFCLDLVDAQGNAITADEYLDEALSSPASAGHSETKEEAVSSAAAPEVFDLLKAYFPKKKRHCMTMAKPCAKDTDLKRANTMPIASLSGAFQRGLNAFVHKIKKGGIPFKTIFGDSPIDGTQFATMFETFLTSLNAGTTPVVQDVWAGMAQGQCTKVARTCLDSFRSQAASLVSASGTVAGAPAKLAERLRQALERFDAQSCGPEALKATFRKSLEEDLARETKVAHAKMDRVVRDALTQDILQFWPNHCDQVDQLTAPYVKKFCDQVLDRGKSLAGDKVWLYALLLTHTRQWLWQVAALSTSALRKTRADLDKAGEAMRAWEEKGARSAQDLQASEDKASKLTEELEKLRTDHQAATVSAGELRSSLEAAEAEHAERSAAQDTEITSLRAKTEEIFVMAKQSAELQQLCAEYASSVQVVKADLDRALESRKDQETQFAESLQAMEEATTETVRDVRSQLQAALEAKSRAVAREQELSAMSSALVQQLETAKGALASMEAETKSLGTALSTLKRTSAVVAADHTSTVQRLELKVSATSANLQKKTEEARTLAGRVSELDKNLHATQIQMVKLEAERDHLVRELQTERAKVLTAVPGQPAASSIADSKLEQMKQRLLALRTQTP